MREDYDLAEDVAFEAKPVGVMRSPHKVHVGTPRQPRAETAETELGGADGEIVIKQGLQNLLKDLDGFSHIWVVTWCNYCYGWNDMVAPPRDPAKTKRGLFATRAPHRPNPIAISVLELRSVDRRRLRVGAHDILDGTPILDIKPYLPYADSVPDASTGWVGALGHRAGPDHRDWQAAEKNAGEPTSAAPVTSPGASQATPNWRLRGTLFGAVLGLIAFELGWIAYARAWSLPWSLIADWCVLPGLLAAPAGALMGCLLGSGVDDDTPRESLFGASLYGATFCGFVFLLTVGLAQLLGPAGGWGEYELLPRQAYVMAAVGFFAAPLVRWAWLPSR